MVITVQQMVKRGYTRILRYALAGSLIIVGLVSVYSPQYNPSAYKLEEEVFEVVEIPDDIEIPPPPQEVEMPKVPVQIEISDEASDDDTIEDTSFDFTDDIPMPTSDMGAGGPKVFYAFDDPPTPIYMAKVKYPELAREAEMEGLVLVLIFVDERGNVFNVQVLRTTVPQILVDEAVAAAWKCRFKPGKQRQMPVKPTISVPGQFQVRR